MLLVLCTAAPALAQTGTVSGIVIDDRTEAPIRGVSIYVEGQPDKAETDANGRFSLTVPAGKLPMLRRQDVPIVATVNAKRTTRDRWFIPSPKLADGRAGFKTVVNDPTPDVGQTIRVTSLARDTSGRPVPGLLVVWTWDLGSTSVRTSAVTNSEGRAYSYRKITSSITSGTVPVTGRVQSYSQNRSSSTAFNRN